MPDPNARPRPRQGRTVIMQPLGVAPWDRNPLALTRWGEPQDASRRYGVPIETPDALISVVELLTRDGLPVQHDTAASAESRRLFRGAEPRSVVVRFRAGDDLFLPWVVDVQPITRSYAAGYNYSIAYPEPELTNAELEAVEVETWHGSTPLGVVGVIKDFWPDGLDVGRPLIGDEKDGAEAAWDILNPCTWTLAVDRVLLGRWPDGWRVRVRYDHF